MTKKMTKVEMFSAIREVVSENAEMVAFIDHEIELISKKAASKKPTKVQVENEGFKAEILTYLTEVGKAVTIKEMQSAVECLAELSNQKMTHLLSALITERKISKEYEKKTPFYSIA
jgi:formate dehydrogenase maturation protein FdhE